MTTLFTIIAAAVAMFSAESRTLRIVRLAERTLRIKVTEEQAARVLALVQANPHKLMRIKDHILYENGSMVPNCIYVGKKYVSLETKTIDLSVHGLTNLTGLEITPSKTTVFVRTMLDKAALEHGDGDCLLGYFHTEELVEARRLRDAKTEIVVRSN